MTDFESCPIGTMKRAEEAEKQLAEVSAAYVSAMMFGSVLLKVVDHKSASFLDRFGACIFCNRHISFGCSESCEMKIAKKAIDAMRNEPKDQGEIS